MLQCQKAGHPPDTFYPSDLKNSGPSRLDHHGLERGISQTI